MLSPYVGTNISRAAYEASNYSDLERATSHLGSNVVLIKGVVRRTLLGQANQPTNPAGRSRGFKRRQLTRRKEESGA